MDLFEIVEGIMNFERYDSLDSFEKQYQSSDLYKQNPDWVQDLKKIFNYCDISYKNVYEANDKVREFSDVRIPRADDPNFLDPLHQKFWLCIFSEHHLNENIYKITKINKKRFKAIRGYTKNELKIALDFLLLMTLHFGTINENLKEKDCLYIAREFFDCVPQKKFRNAIHMILQAEDKQGRLSKKSYCGEFKTAIQKAEKIFQTLSESEKRSLKPSFNEAVKVLKFFHKKYRV